MTNHCTHRQLHAVPATPREPAHRAPPPAAAPRRLTRPRPLARPHRQHPRLHPPVRLTGQLHTVEKATGRILDTRHTTTAMPDGVLYVPCGDRRASVCPPCAETYRADTYQLIRPASPAAKASPPSSPSHPAVFATLTAPSFGPVHTRQINRRTGKVAPCRMRRDLTRLPPRQPLVCTARHTENHPSLGRPLCLDCYDHAHHVVWNAWAGELWRRTTITLAPLARSPSNARHGVEAADLLRQGRRIPAPRRRPLPRPHPPRPP